MESPRVVFWGVPKGLLADPYSESHSEKGPDEELPFELIDAAEVIVVHSSVGQDQVTDLLNAIKLSETHPSIILIEGKEVIPPNLFYEGGGTRVLFEQDITSQELIRALVQVDRIRKLQDENTRLVAKLTEANQLLEEKNHRLDEFSATVAHDIRGPLGGVIMKLEYLRDRYAEKLDDRFSVLMNRALGSAERLTEVVQGMYEFAKLGGDAPNMGIISLTQIIEDVITDLHIDPDKRVEFSIGDLPEVWGNAQLMRRVFLNFFTNSIRYSDKEVLHITVKLRSTTSRPLADFAEIEVIDNGPGIPIEEHSRIFSFFSRGADVAAKTEGLGIGLAIVKRIIELHYGDVRVESSTRGGTTFVCSIPMTKIAFNN